jgi:hypothetical protein
MKPRQGLNFAILANQSRDAFDQFLAMSLGVLRHAFRLSMWD